MLEENKNLTDQAKGPVKDPILESATQYGAGTSSMSLNFSYIKVNKLVTALYMVTDMLENEEPLRRKLRTLGAEIITDIYLAQHNVDKKIAAIISLLDIGSTINLISEMNCNILKKEFIQLKQSTKEPKQDLVLLDFLQKNEMAQEDGNGSFVSANRPASRMIISANNPNKNSIGSIGIQKGNTLMKALKRVGGMSEKKFTPLKDTKDPFVMSDRKNNFDALKRQRRDQIIKIIKEKKEQVSIKDIALALQNIGEDTGEKTLQRELVSMVNDGVLKKVGEKRWSRYFL